MTRPSRIPSRWILNNDTARDADCSPRGSHIVAPSVPDSPLTLLLSGLTPDRDHNGDLLRRLRHLPKAEADQPVFATFAADPFLNPKDLARRLLRKGYRRVVNWPTTAQYGADFCRTLDSVDLGLQQEYKNLSLFAEQKLSLSLAVCGAEAAAEIARLRPEIVFLTPGFDLWANGKLRTGELLHRCVALARVTPRDIPIVLMAARGSLSLAQARKAGASALLVA